MTPISDRSFPCFLWLSEHSSEQNQEFEERPGSDYVFFDPSADLKRCDGNSVNGKHQRNAVSNSRTIVSGQTFDLPSGESILCGAG